MRLTSFQARILVVNDTKYVLKTLKTYLRHYGFTSFTTGSGKRTLGIAQQTQPDLILLDLVNSNLDSIKIGQRLKMNPYTNKIPLIFLTEVDKVIEIVKNFTAGGVDYLVKPFQEQELIARITICLRESERFWQLPYDKLDYGLLATTETTSPHLKSISMSELGNIHGVQQYLLEHLNAHHSLAELAHFAYTNRNKLNRSFQTLVGKSVFEWLREQRLQQAAKLLTTTSHQIQKISERVGYPNPAHFTTQFKQRFQMTPRQYRNIYRLNKRLSPMNIIQSN